MMVLRILIDSELHAVTNHEKIFGILLALLGDLRAERGDEERAMQDLRESLRRLELFFFSPFFFFFDTQTLAC